MNPYDNCVGIPESTTSCTCTQVIRNFEHIDLLSRMYLLEILFAAPTGPKTLHPWSAKQLLPNRFAPCFYPSEESLFDRRIVRWMEMLHY